MIITDIISAPYTTFFKNEDGDWYACGVVNFGIDGLSQSIIESEPKKIELTGIDKIRFNSKSIVYILNDGTAYVCGQDISHSLGMGDGLNQYHMAKHPLENIDDIYFMTNYSEFELATHYTIFKTKDNEFLVSGKFNGEDYRLPQRFDFEAYMSENKIMLPVKQANGLYKIYNAPDGLPQNIKQVVSNNDFTYFLTTSGLVYAAGTSFASNFGLSLSQNKLLSIDLIQLPILNVRSVKIGANHVLFLNNSNELYGCGNNDLGQLGFGMGIPTIPKITLIDNDVQFIEAGINQSFYANLNGDLRFMGKNTKWKFGEPVINDETIIFKPTTHTSLKFSTKVHDFILPEKKKIDYTYKGIYHRIIIQYEKIDDDTIKMSSYIHTPSLGNLNQIHEDYLFKLTTDILQEAYNNIDIVSNQRIQNIKEYIAKYTNYYETPHYSTNTIIKLSNGSLIEVTGEKTKDECIEIVKNYVYKKYNTIYDGNKYYSKEYPDNLVIGDITWRPKGSKIYTLSELNKDKYNYY